jgi:Cu2+-exporting ATPase
MVLLLLLRQIVVYFCALLVVIVRSLQKLARASEYCRAHRERAAHHPRFGQLEKRRTVLTQDLVPIVKFYLLSKPRSEAEWNTNVELEGASIGLSLSLGSVLFPPLQFAGLAWAGSPVFRIFQSGFTQLERGRVTTDVLTGILLAGALWGGYFLFVNLGLWFWVFVHWLALKTEAQSKQGVIDLFAEQGRLAWKMVEGTAIEVPVEQVHVGDLIAIQAGQTAPLDGWIVEGWALIDQHTLTGEAQPAEKGPDDRVLAGTLVLSGRVMVRVEKAGDATTAAEIGRMLTDTRAFTESLAFRANAFNDKVALPCILLGMGSLPFIGLNSALAVLMATPGYRMILYGPLSLLSHLHIAAREGILIKDGRSLELLREVDTIVFDKTGTLTIEQPEVREIHTCPGFRRETVLRFAAIAETGQTHPIARAILEAAADEGILAVDTGDIEYQVGYGISVKLEGVTVRVGSMRYMRLSEIPVPAEVQALQDTAHNAGHSLVLVGVDQWIAGAIVLQPAVRPEARAIVRQLRGRGARIYIMSGDHDAPTQRLARQLGMDSYFAEVLPTEKADLVRRLQAQGRKVCFIGDGINDAIALKCANVSISLHGATAIATDTAQIVLMDGDLIKLPRIFELAKELEDNMQVNFIAATVPAVVIIFSALFLGLGLVGSTILYQVSVPFALYNSVRPLLRHRSTADAADRALVYSRHTD